MSTALRAAAWLLVLVTGAAAAPHSTHAADALTAPGGSDARGASERSAAPPGAAYDVAPDPRGATRPRATGPQAGLQRIGTATIHREHFEGSTTASGEVYNRNTLTAGHRSLPFGTMVRVTNVRNQRTVIVRINDRSPNIGNRIIDLTPRAASLIGMLGISTAEVRLDVLGAGGTPEPLPRDARDGAAEGAREPR